MGYCIMERGVLMKKNLIMAGVLCLLVAGVTDDLHAYTYTFQNRTGYLVRVVVELYDGEGGTSEIDAHGSYALSTPLLLKSWKVEAFHGGRWEPVMNNTCDMLPGNHAYSIHVDEKREPSGAVTRGWHSAYQ
jgi:hypothetical protein